MHQNSENAQEGRRRHAGKVVVRPYIADSRAFLWRLVNRQTYKLVGTNYSRLVWIPLDIHTVALDMYTGIAHSGMVIADGEGSGILDGIDTA